MAKDICLMVPASAGAPARVDHDISPLQMGKGTPRTSTEGCCGASLVVAVALDGCFSMAARKCCAMASLDMAGFKAFIVAVSAFSRSCCTARLLANALVSHAADAAEDA